ncbi:MAG: hypothetical protein ACOYMG_16920, partial [Candidatus Methylumidiphilus sp.]
MLGCYEHNGVMFSEVLEFLAFLVDGEWRRFPLPRAEIKDILCTSRPFFGKGSSYVCHRQQIEGACNGFFYQAHRAFF